MNAFLAIVARDLRLGFGAQGAMLTTLLFFVLAVSLFPLGVGPEPQILARIAAGVIWVAALLAAMLSLDRLFQTDQEDGTLDLLAQAPLPLGLVALAKTLAHWFTTGLPLSLIAPLLAILLQNSVQARVLAATRARVGFLTPENVEAAGAILPQGVGFVSSFFEVSTAVQIGGTRQAIQSLVQRRRGEEGVEEVAVVRRRNATAAVPSPPPPLTPLPH